MTAAKKTTGKNSTTSNITRIKIPVDLKAWAELPENQRELLLWFHQHVIDSDMSHGDCERAIDYDWSTIFRVLKSDYDGSYRNVCRAIAQYQKIMAKRGTIQGNELVETRITKMVHSGLDYALANNSITLITGDSGMGKTVSIDMWRRDNREGTSVSVTAPVLGGSAMLLRYISAAVGVDSTGTSHEMYDSICKAFNEHRILIVDEAHRLLPRDRRGTAIAIEILRDLHDRTGCALALAATQRFGDQLRRSEYMFEQLLRRIGMPISLPSKLVQKDWLPILRQYVAKPDAKTIAMINETINDGGRLGILVETLKIASRLATNAKRRAGYDDVRKAIAIRHQMMNNKK